MNGSFGPPLDRPVKTPINRGLFQLYEATKDRLSSFGRPLAPRQALSRQGPMETERTATNPKAAAYSVHSSHSQASWSGQPLTEVLAHHSRALLPTRLPLFDRRQRAPKSQGFCGRGVRSPLHRRLIDTEKASHHCSYQLSAGESDTPDGALLAASINLE